MPVQTAHELYCLLSTVKATLLKYTVDLSQSVRIEVLNELSFLIVELQANLLNIIKINKQAIEDISKFKSDDSILDQISKFESENESKIDNISENIPNIEDTSKSDTLINQQASNSEIETRSMQSLDNLAESEATVAYTDTVKQSMGKLFCKL